jgi:LemA protein|nr:LemA family protein [Candidatus Krumholzibacteria bacterium]
MYPVLILIGVVAAYGILTYNRFVSLRQRLTNAFSDVDVQLKRRWDLVPALVETVRGYAGHENEVLTRVTAARSAAMQAPTAPADLPQRGQLESGLASALGGIFLLAEDYPALKADTNFLSLHHSLVEIEDDLQSARRYHNAVVRDLNTLRHSFPANLVGQVAGVAEGQFFQLDDAQRAVPAIDLTPNNRPEGE